MSKRLYVRRQQHQGKTYGPYGLAELRSLAASGKLVPSDKVSQDGKKWVSATRIKPSLFQEAVPQVAEAVEATEIEPTTEVLEAAEVIEVAQPVDTAEVTEVNAGDNPFGALPDFESAHAPVKKPVAIPTVRPAPSPTPSKPAATKRSKGKPKTTSTDASNLMMIAGGAVGAIVLLAIIIVVMSTVGSGLMSAKEMEFATNSSEPRTTTQWIEFMRATYGRKKSVVRTQGATVARQEADKAVNFVDFDPAATEVLFDALTDPERRISQFAAKVLMKASKENAPDKEVVYERLESPEINVRSIATSLLLTIPDGPQDNMATLEANLSDPQLSADSLACLGSLDGAQDQYLPEFQKLDRDGRHRVLSALTTHQFGDRVISWYSPEYNKDYETASLVLALKNVDSETRNAFAVGALDRNASRYEPLEKVRAWFADLDADVADELFSRLEHQDEDVRHCAACALHTIGPKLASENATRIVDQIERLAEDRAVGELIDAVGSMGGKARQEAARLVQLMPELSYRDNACKTLVAIGFEQAGLPAGDLVGLVSGVMEVVGGNATSEYFYTDQPAALIAKIADALSKQSIDPESLADLKTRMATWKLWTVKWEQKAKEIEIKGQSQRVTVYIKGEYDAAASAEKTNEYKKTVSRYRTTVQFVDGVMKQFEPLVVATDS